MASNIPSEPPPAYEASSSSTSQRPTHLNVPHKTRSGIPPEHRRSMEDESRTLPSGWIRQYDPETDHQFFVDQHASPPRSIWHHPYDDEEYLSSIAPAERDRIASLHRVPTHADMVAESSDDDTHNPPTGAKKLGRKMKDKLTSSTHEERQRDRARREEAEARAYAQHRAFRVAMSKAAQTGEPQLLGKDKNGKDVYVEPPGPGPYGYGGGGYGFNPYAQGMYGRPNAGYARPGYGYGRPYGGGYGGGMGMPLMGLGGLGGGLMMGSLLF
ncbi:hypothetical protein LOCC1_G008007 [Lachnellula occidentalis]|uniref:WW domain-containing protein n=1 Tax=Lachnellula occidentalis TaxID=215460 RepID=A0A8H8RV72_9HELO|nr:hypothetical protein LOCC1_G008007 [Lachnellula occidentalis]